MPGTGPCPAVMAEADLLDVPALDKAAGEEFLQEAFGVILEEAVRRGTDVAEKVGLRWSCPGTTVGGVRRGFLLAVGCFAWRLDVFLPLGHGPCG